MTNGALRRRLSWKRKDKEYEEKHISEHLRRNPGRTGGMGEGGLTGKGQVVCQVPDRYAEEPGDFGEEVILRFGISVLPVGDGAARQAEDLIAACPGHALLFPEDPEIKRKPKMNL